MGRQKGVPQKDLSGQVFGDFEVIDFRTDGKWNCKCVKCGHKAIKNSETLHKWKNYCPKCKSPIGKIFGDFEVLERVTTEKKYEYLYRCRCIHCGYTENRSYGLLNHKKNKCSVCNETYGKAAYKKLPMDLTGQTFDDLTVIEYFDSHSGHSRWKCQCTCNRICYKTTNDLHRKNKFHTCPVCSKALNATSHEKLKPNIPKTGDIDLLNNLISQGEVFKPIKGFEDYHMGTFGDLFSYKSGVPHLMKSFLDSQGRYHMVTLCKNGERRKYSVHRLVALTFLANPNNLPEVNHIDTNTHNNHLENLEWCDALYNTTRSYQTMPPNRNRRRCRLIFPDGTEKEFDSYADVIRYRRENNLDFSESSLVCRGTSRGFALIKLEKASNKGRAGLNINDSMIRGENYREVMI